MARISRRPKLSLTHEEVKYLEKLSHSRSEPASLVQRAKIVLLSFQGINDTNITQELNVAYNTVRTRIQRVLDFGVIEGLKDKTGSGRPRTITNESRAWLIKVACMKPKDFGYPHEIWTQRLLTKYVQENCVREGHPELLKISQGTISKILNASNIKPHKIRYYAAKVDPDFDEKAKKVLGTYKEVKKLKKNFKKKKKVDRIILSCDEKTGIQAIGNKYPDMMPVDGKYPSMARDYEYIRHGTLSLFACIDLITGKVYHKVFERSRSREFIEIVKEVVSDCQDTKIVAILDNYKIHTSEETNKYLSTLKKGKLKFVFTPKHASWLNIIESFFSKMSRGFLRAIRVKSIMELKNRIDQYINLLNEDPVVFMWKYKVEGEDRIPGGIAI